jgi:hypothetical protein
MASRQGRTEIRPIHAIPWIEAAFGQGAHFESAGDIHQAIKGSELIRDLFERAPAYAIVSQIKAADTKTRPTRIRRVVETGNFGARGRHFFGDGRSKRTKPARNNNNAPIQFSHRGASSNLSAIERAPSR